MLRVSIVMLQILLLLYVCGSISCQNATTVVPENVTDLSVNDTSSSWENETISNETTTPVSTSPIPTLQPPYNATYIPVSNSNDMDSCSCDLKANSCDINCCCDKNCTFQDRQSFVSCQEKVTAIYDLHYCYRSEIVFWNNTRFRMDKIRDDMFCIVEDNVEDKTSYTNTTPAETITDFEKILQGITYATWPITVGDDYIYSQAKQYTAGDHISMLHEDLVTTLGFPARIMTVMCDSFISLAYLEDYAGSCNQDLDPIAEKCTSLASLNLLAFSSEFCILDRLNMTEKILSLDPEFVIKGFHNKDGIAACSKIHPHLISIVPCLCLDDYCDNYTCSVYFPSLTPTYKNGTCYNVVKTVRYVIRHNGTDGIKGVRALIQLTNTTGWVLHQSFSATFEWVNENVSVVVHRSGNPGYLPYTPIQIGYIKNHTMNETALPSGWLTTFKPVAGICDLKSHSRRRILFQENYYVGCILKETLNSGNNSCVILRNNLFQYLLGGAEINGTHVASFGNFDGLSRGDWIPILVSKSLSLADKRNIRHTCNDIVTELHIRVAYVSTGFVQNPQYKIAGVHYQFGEPISIRFRCTGLFCPTFEPVVITTTVAFIKVNTAGDGDAVHKTPQAETASKELFYPFLCTSDSSLTCWLVFALVIFVPAVFWVFVLTNQTNT